MRTYNPHDIKADFLAGLQEIETTFITASDAVSSTASRNHLAEYSFLAASVLLEGFISDLFVAYIHKASGAFVSHLKGKLTIEGKDTLGKRAAGIAQIGIGPRLTPEKIRKILDPEDHNLSFTTPEKLLESAGRWLEEPYRQQFLSLSDSERAVLVAIKALRNYLAHRSLRARSALQDALNDPKLPDGLKRGSYKVLSAGSWLDLKPSPSSPKRLQTFLTKIRAIAEKLNP